MCLYVGEEQLGGHRKGRAVGILPCGYFTLWVFYPVHRPNLDTLLENSSGEMAITDYTYFPQLLTQFSALLTCSDTFQCITDSYRHTVLLIHISVI